MAWYCVVWYGTVWCFVVWCGIVWYGMDIVLCCGPDDKAVEPSPGMDPSIWGSPGQTWMVLPPFTMIRMIRQQSKKVTPNLPALAEGWD